MNSSLSEVRSPRGQFLSAPVDAELEDTPQNESWGERFYGALPLFFVGGACVVVAVELYVTGNVAVFGGDSSVRLRPWILFLALGIIGLSAGIVALFAEEDASEPPGFGAPVAAPSPAPDWDESWIEPETKVFPRRRPWETSSGAFGQGVTGPSSADIVLQQLDEIERSLQRKQHSPPPE